MPENNTSQFWETDSVSAPATGVDAKTDFWSADVPSEPTGQQALSAFGKGMAGGAIEATPALGGAIAGGIMGGPFGAFAGGVAGAFIGHQARTIAAEQGIGIASPQDLPLEERPYAVAGETFGAGISMIGGTAALAKTGYQTLGTTAVGRYVNNVLNLVKDRTALVLTGETAAAASAAIAGGAAEYYDPGAAGTRFAAEVTAGFLNPTRIVTSTANSAINKTISLYERLSPAARQTAAAKSIQQALTQGGEDPAAIAELLRLYDPAITNNVAQITGSETLGAWSIELAKHSAKYGAESKQAAEGALDTLTGMIEVLGKTGDPQALKEAALLKKQLMDATLKGQVSAAEEATLEAAAKITKDTPAAKMEIGKIASDLLGRSLVSARQVETQLWEKIPEVPVGIDNFKNTVDAVQQGMVLNKMPSAITQFLKTVDEGEPITSKTLTTLRSELLTKSREATHKGDFNDARIFGELAESTLDDLNAAFNGNEAYDMARSFSRSLNDTFTRTFAGKALAQGQYGARIPPEMLMVKAMSSGKEAAALQMGELEQTTRFLETHNIADDVGLVPQMLDAQERMIRLAAANSIDNLTGKVNPKQLSKFIADNEVLMNRFPEVRANLQSAIDSELGLQGMQAIANKTTRTFESETAFGKVLKSDPIVMTQKALKSGDPAKDLGDLITVAKSSGQVGIEGLRTSVIDSAIRQNTATNGVLRFDKIEETLFKSPAAGRPSPMDVLVKNGIFDETDVNNLKKVFTYAKRIQTAQKPGTRVEIKEDELGTLSNLVARALGSWVATKAAGVTGADKTGRGLIIAAGGARAGVDILEKIPNARIKDILVDAMSNPPLMAKLLEKPVTIEEQVKQQRFLHAYFYASGLYGIEGWLESEKEPAKAQMQQ